MKYLNAFKFSLLILIVGLVAIGMVWNTTNLAVTYVAAIFGAPLLVVFVVEGLRVITEAPTEKTTFKKTETPEKPYVYGFTPVSVRKTKETEGFEAAKSSEAY